MREILNILFFGLTYCILGNISLTSILNMLNMLKHVWNDTGKGYFVSEDLHWAPDTLVKTDYRTTCSSRSLSRSSAPRASPGVRVTSHLLSKTLV